MLSSMSTNGMVLIKTGAGARITPPSGSKTAAKMRLPSVAAHRHATTVNHGASWSGVFCT